MAGPGTPGLGGGVGRHSSSHPCRFLAELGGVRGLQLNFLELGSNRAGWLQVWRRHRAPGSSLVSLGCIAGPDAGTAHPAHLLRFPQWQVRFDCFPAESGRQVLVSLRTIPDRGLALSRSRLVVAEPPGEAGRDPGGRPEGRRHRLTLPTCSTGPVFTHAWVPEARAIEVWVPEGPALMVRLCHQLALECEELPRPFHRQVMAPVVPSLGCPPRSPPS